MSSTESNPLLKEFQAEDVDLARQLLSLNQRPGDALQGHIQSIPQDSPSRHRRRLSGLVGGGVALVFIVMLFNSPGAKATLGQVQKVVGRIQLTVTEVKPTYTEPVIAPSVSLSLAEARATIPFDFAMPTYLPDGLNSNNEVSIIELEISLVKILWRDSKNGFVQLTAQPHNGQTKLARTLVGPESNDTILINGRPAVIVYGAWDGSGQTWSYQERITTLIWNVEGVQYKLLAFRGIISLSDLTTMAESVR
jgi:hypothetical protein